MTQLSERKQNLEACSRSFLIQTDDKRSYKISNKVHSSRSTDVVLPLEIGQYASTTANNRDYNQNATTICLTNNKSTKIIHLLNQKKPQKQFLPNIQINTHAKAVNGLNAHHIHIVLYTDAYQSCNTSFFIRPVNRTSFRICSPQTCEERSLKLTCTSKGQD